MLDVTNQNNSPEKRYSDLVSETIDCIRKEYHQELTLKAIADRLHVNGVYLGQCFKNETERSFTQYLNHVRIQKRNSYCFTPTNPSMKLLMKQVTIPIIILSRCLKVEWFIAKRVQRSLQGQLPSHQGRPVTLNRRLI